MDFSDMAEYICLTFESVDDFCGCPYLFEPKYANKELRQFDKQSSEWDLDTYSPERMKGKRNDLHAVVRDLHCRLEPVSGEKKHLWGNKHLAPRILC